MYDFIKDLTLYNLVRGPLVWIAFLAFIGGSIYRVYGLIDLAKKEKVVFPFLNPKAAFQSLLHWVVPFASRNWRKRWAITTITFLFHFGIVVLPFFVLGHIVLINESWGISWWTFSGGFADFMTIVVMLSCVFFFLRRFFAQEVKFVSLTDDFLMLGITFMPFLTGFLAYHQLLLPHKIILMLHILFGELMLIAIPFTRLGHMFYFFLTRTWMGSQFALWHSRDW
jgi:nitrate reductase gamma subunit